MLYRNSNIDFVHPQKKIHSFICILCDSMSNSVLRNVKEELGRGISCKEYYLYSYYMYYVQFCQYCKYSFGFKYFIISHNTKKKKEENRSSIVFSVWVFQNIYIGKKGFVTIVGYVWMQVQKYKIKSIYVHRRRKQASISIMIVEPYQNSFVELYYTYMEVINCFPHIFIFVNVIRGR